MGQGKLVATKKYEVAKKEPVPSIRMDSSPAFTHTNHWPRGKC